MAIPTTVVLNRVQETLLDETGIYWDEPELLDYINAAISSLCLIKPDTYTVTDEVVLTLNNTRQELPENGFQFFDVTRNLFPKKSVVTIVERNQLDHADPDWHDKLSNKIQHYVYEEVNPTVFHVYPAPNTPGQSVELVYAVSPDRIDSSLDSFPLQDIYETPIYFMTLSFAYGKNAKRGDLVKSKNYYDMFAQSIGLRSQTQYQLGPRVPDKPA